MRSFQEVYFKKPPSALKNMLTLNIDIFYCHYKLFLATAVSTLPGVAINSEVTLVLLFY